jgi:hypothetical protein
MQGKGGVLKKSFSMIITIVFIIVMSVIGVMILQFSSSSNAHVSRSFMDTRANLMLKSATEYAILALQGHDFNNGCLNNINLSDKLFNVNIKYHYFLTDCNSSSCQCSRIKTADTNGSVLVYVSVASKNPNFHIRKVRFTLQNP